MHTPGSQRGTRGDRHPIQHGPVEGRASWHCGQPRTQISRIAGCRGGVAGDGAQQHEVVERGRARERPQPLERLRLGALLRKLLRRESATSGQWPGPEPTIVFNINMHHYKIELQNLLMVPDR